MRGQHRAAAEFAQMSREHRARERRGIGIGERRRNAAHRERRGSEDRDREAERVERVRVLLRRPPPRAASAANVAGTSSGCTGTLASSARFNRS